MKSKMKSIQMLGFSFKLWFLTYIIYIYLFLFNKPTRDPTDDPTIDTTQDPTCEPTTDYTVDQQLMQLQILLLIQP